MIQRKKRIVLFLPHRADPAEGVRVAADLLPLELLQIAAFPDEAEVLYPPLTYLLPTGREDCLAVDSVEYSIIEVEPRFAT